MTVEARLVRTLGETRAAQVVELAKVLGDQDSERRALEGFTNLHDAPIERRPIGPRSAVRIAASDAAAAGGPELIRRTISSVTRHDSPDVHAKAAAVIAALRDIAPRGPVEGGLAGLFIAMERSAFDCLRIAHLAGLDTPMGMIMLARAEKLTCRAIEAADALSRQRCRGHQTIRIEHINQAVVAVSGGGRESDGR
jgi:hypothetical protein